MGFLGSFIVYKYSYTCTWYISYLEASRDSPVYSLNVEKQLAVPLSEWTFLKSFLLSLYLVVLSFSGWKISEVNRCPFWALHMMYIKAEKVIKIHFSRKGNWKSHCHPLKAIRYRNPFCRIASPPHKLWQHSNKN